MLEHIWYDIKNHTLFLRWHGSINGLVHDDDDYMTGVTGIEHNEEFFVSHAQIAQHCIYLGKL